jgi:hypothetical protein
VAPENGPLANSGLGLSPSFAVGEIRNLRNLFRLLEGQVGIADRWEKLMGQYLVIGKQTHDAHRAATMGVYGYGGFSRSAAMISGGMLELNCFLHKP